MRLTAIATPLWLASFQLLTCTYGGVDLRTRDSRAISVPSSQFFDGDDGPWSSFSIQAGTPPQPFRVFVSTSISATWLILPVGCSAGALTCPSERGNVYNVTASTTWREQGNHILLIGEDLIPTAAGTFGNDTVGIGNGGPTLSDQVVAGIATGQFWLGMFGLNPKATNYTPTDPGQPSFMTTLRQQNLIPSLSYGYTAGNQYRLKTVLGSLTLGGYDSARFAPNDITFPLAANNTADLIVGIQAIKSTDSNGKSHDLLSSGILAHVDSSVADIWLPAESCALFEQAFGLVYDSVNMLYPVNSTWEATLKALNPNVTFTLGNGASGGPTVSITLPYAAFDLQATWPKYPNGTRYFPLQRATNPANYTLGRTFLQEAYLTVDYERGNFSISQAIFPDSLGKNIVPITAPDNSTTNPSSSSQPTSSSSSNSTKIGIALGVVLGLLLLISAIAIFLLRRRRSQRNTSARSQSQSHSPRSPSLLSHLRKFTKYTRPPPFSRSSSGRTIRIDETFDKVEMNTDIDHSRYEAPGSEPNQESRTLLPPPAAFSDQEPARNFSNHFPSELGGDTQHVHPPRSGTEDFQPQEMYASGSFAPIELPATEEPLLMPQSQSSTADSPAEADAGAVRRSSSGRKGSLRSLRGGRPGLHHRHSTLDSLPSAPSEGGTPEPREGEFFSPISPVGERAEWTGGEEAGR
ncbi:hypothetical protein MMC30_001839 [Trapelia coarctata]|nr:hypothetical protein [Trapelia coarctata]